MVHGALRVIIHWLHRVVLQGSFEQQCQCDLSGPQAKLEVSTAMTT